MLIIYIDMYMYRSFPPFNQHIFNKKTYFGKNMFLAKLQAVFVYCWCSSKVSYFVFD